jgi:hypothetical protein
VVVIGAALYPLKENHLQAKGMELSIKWYFISDSVIIDKHKPLTGGK